MASLGSLVIELAANTARMQSDLGRAVNLAQTASSRMTAAFRTVSGALGAGGLSLTASAVFAKFVQNSSEAQASMVKLEGAVRRAGAASGVTLAQIESLALGIQSSSKFSDEAVKGAAASLLKFDKVTGETFTRALKISADLAEVMGTDVPEAASQLGKALQLPGEGLRVLTNAGIKFNDEQIKTLQYMTETGQAVEAQNIILDELAKRTSGAASEGVKTLGGAFAQLGNQIGELAEAPGIITAIANATSSLAETMAKSMPAVKAGFSELHGYIKAAADQAVTLGKAILDPIGAIRGTGLFAPKPESLNEVETRNKPLTDALVRHPLGAQTKARLAAEAAAEASKKAAAQSRKQADEIERVIDYYKDLDEMTMTAAERRENEFRRTQNALVDLLEAGKISGDQYEARMKEAAESAYEVLEEVETSAKPMVETFVAYLDQMVESSMRASQSMQMYFESFIFDPFHDGLKGMLRGFVDTLRHMVAEAAAAKIFGTKTVGVGGKSTGGLGLGDLITSSLGGGLKKLFGFADGGSFQVGGSGGTDSQLVAFKASPNERVSVTKPGQGGAPVTIHQVNDFRGATADVMKTVPAMIARANAQLEAKIYNRINGGAFS